MPTLKIPQKKLDLTVESGKNLMDALIEGGLPVASSCLGDGICSKCSVIMNPAGQANELELRTMNRNKVPAGRRLCCQVFVEQDLTVETTYW